MQSSLNKNKEKDNQNKPRCYYGAIIFIQEDEKR